MSPTALIFSQIHLPLPLDYRALVEVLERLAIDPHADDIVFETHADSSGIRHLIGATGPQIPGIRRAFEELIPGTLLTGLGTFIRPSQHIAGRIAFLPASLPLSTSEPSRIARGIYTMLSTKFRAGEAVLLQIGLGRGQAPRQLPRRVGDPQQTWPWQELLGTRQDADPEVRRLLKDRASQFSVECFIRIGAMSPDRSRRERFATELQHALAMATGPGTRLTLVREPIKAINAPTSTPKYRSRMSLTDLVSVSGLPFGEARLPGMPSLHPKTVRAAQTVETKERRFAVSAAPGDDRALGLRAEDGLFHGLAIGPTGSGKSTTLASITVADIQADFGVAVIDPKAELAEVLAARTPHERIDDVVWIDPSDERPIGFNPLDSEGRDPDVVADGVLSVFAKSFAEGWGPRTADIFSASLRTLTRGATPKDPTTLIDLPKLWTDRAFRKKLLGRIGDDIGLVSFWSAYDSLSPAAQANWIASPMNKLRSILLRPAAVKILGQAKPAFRMRDTFAQNKILLVSLNEGIIGPLTAELIGGLVVAELWQAAQERAKENPKTRRPAFVTLDEADRFMALPVSIADALARSRSLGVGWMLAVQHFQQLPTAMQSAVRSNARTKIAWAMSDEDARVFARMAPGLSDEDFMQLPRFHVYANLVADGLPTGWASAKTLPLGPSLGDPRVVRSRSHELYGPSLIDAEEPVVEPLPDPTDGLPTAPGMKRRSAS